VKRNCLVCTILLLTCLHQAAAQVSFAPATTYYLGGAYSPESVIAADVNGYGKVDLISADYAYNPVGILSVFTNNGNGSFVLASSPTASVGSFTQSVVAADVNGDGKLDLISANSGDGTGNTLSVLTNNRGGGFTLASSPIVGESPWSVVAADVNGDGKVDLICANAAILSKGVDGTLSVLTNRGNGLFVTAGTYIVGAYPMSVTAADVNGDGKMDLICANAGDDSLSVLTNNGSGGFVTAGTYHVGNGCYPMSVIAADVNGDGKVDLICANHDANTLSILTNDGSRGFKLASSPGVGNGPSSVTAADVNGDGWIDLICANYFTNTISVLTNDGRGGFTTAATLTVGNYPVSVTAADVNGDGRPDLICANAGDDSLSVLINTTSNYGPQTAVATVVLIDGFVVAGTITYIGYGYKNALVVQIIGGGGSGAQAAATISNGVVTAITILNAGSGYTSAPTILIGPPWGLPSLGISPATCLGFTNIGIGGSYQLQVLDSVTWDNLGSSFVSPTNSYLEFVDGNGNGSLFRLAMLPMQATAVSQVAYGFVVGATVTSCGSGYESPPAVSIVGGGGSFPNTHG
jgi:FG-GAP-like repeat